MASLPKQKKMPRSITHHHGTQHLCQNEAGNTCLSEHLLPDMSANGFCPGQKKKHRRTKSTTPLSFDVLLIPHSEFFVNIFLKKKFHSSCTEIIEKLHYKDENWNWHDHCNQDFRIGCNEKSAICTIHQISAIGKIFIQCRPQLVAYYSSSVNEL